MRVSEYGKALWHSIGGKWIFLPGFVAGLITIYGFEQRQLEWLPPMSWWIVLPLAALPLVLWIIGGLLRRVVVLEEKTRPKLKLAYENNIYPFIYDATDSRGRSYRCYRMRVKNGGLQQLNSCKAEVERAVRTDGVGVVNIPFSLKGTHYEGETFELRADQELFVDLVAVPLGEHFAGRAAKLAQWGQSWPHVSSDVGEALLPQKPTKIFVQVLSEAPPAKLTLMFEPGDDGSFILRKLEDVEG